MKKQCCVCKELYDIDEMIQLKFMNEYVCKDCEKEVKEEEQFLEYMVVTDQF